MGMANKSLIDGVNANAADVKESIYNAFNCHLKTIRAREQWLVDQVDDIRLATIKSISDASNSSEILNANVQYCDQILNELKEDQAHDAVKQMERTLEVLRLNSDKAARNLEMFEMPNMYFEHDKSSLQREISNYGCIKSKELSEKDSMSLETVSSVGEFTPSDCGKQCCQPRNMFEIEDMDVTHLLREKEKVILEECCQANEVCGGMDECLFDEHCCSNLSPEHVRNLKTYFEELNLSTKMIHPIPRMLEIADEDDTLPYEETESQNYVDKLQEVFNSLTTVEDPISEFDSPSAQYGASATHISDVAAAFGKIMLSETTMSTSTEFEDETSTCQEDSNDQQEHVHQISAIFDDLLRRNDETSMSPKPFQQSKYESDPSVTSKEPLRFISSYVPMNTKSEMDVFNIESNHSFMSDEKLQLVSSKAVDILYSSEKQDSCKDESFNHIDTITSAFTMLNDAY